MPSTKEVKCTNRDCELDMFENHYTYDVPEDHSIEDLQCPYCSQTESLQVISL
jgi:aspartate carbamoyltransferase regulatory subunit